MPHSLVVAALRGAARIVLAASAPATGGDWWADNEVVHAPHWHPDRKGEYCYPLVAQSGGDPDADARWAALVDPPKGPSMAEIFNAVADEIEMTGEVDTVAEKVIVLARGIMLSWNRTTAQQVDTASTPPAL